MIKRCFEAGLIGGEGFAVDASVVKADASRQRHHEDDEDDDDDDDWGGGSQTINEYLDALYEEGSSMTPAKKVSQTDPMARWTAAPGGPAYYADSTRLPILHLKHVRIRLQVRRLATRVRDPGND